MRQSFWHEMTRNTRWNPNWCFNNNLTVNKNSWSELDFWDRYNRLQASQEAPTGLLQKAGRKEVLRSRRPNGCRQLLPRGPAEAGAAWEGGWARGFTLPFQVWQNSFENLAGDALCAQLSSDQLTSSISQLRWCKFNFWSSENVWTAD